MRNSFRDKLWERMNVVISLIRRVFGSSMVAIRTETGEFGSRSSGGARKNL
jgi:hypothetical protein